ncbi:hypothetical protein M405DRAFT_396948 [Rhizopogon salebrosus TDB-379]|nr:hypothetical protein M405DRAFT_396948 [Rhizopogon salebrosus TDB-379]
MLHSVIMDTTCRDDEAGDYQAGFKLVRSQCVSSSPYCAVSPVPSLLRCLSLLLSQLSSNACACQICPSSSSIFFYTSLIGRAVEQFSRTASGSVPLPQQHALSAPFRYDDRATQRTRFCGQGLL